MNAEDVATFERCIAVGGVALFPADTVYGLATEPDSQRGRPAALRGQGPAARHAGRGDVLRARAGAGRAAGARRRAPARALERLLPGRLTLCSPTRRGASRSPAAPARPPRAARAGCAGGSRRCATSWPVLQSSANPRGGADARRLDDVDPRIRRGVDLQPRRRRAARHASTVVDLGDYEDDGRIPSAPRGRGGRRGAWRRCDSVPVADTVTGMTDLRPDYFTKPVSEVDPEIAQVLEDEAAAPGDDAGDDRLRELRAAGDARLPGLRAHQQVRRGLPGQALLRRLRVRGRRRGARDRPREGALRGRARQRAAARRRPGQRRRLPRAAGAGRPHPGHEARPRRPPHARDEDQLLGPPLRHRRLRRARGGLAHRHGRARAARRGVQAQADPRRLVGLPAPARLRALPRDRRLGGRPADGRHGALRRAGRRGRAPQSRCPTPTWSPPPSTRRSAARAAA